LASAQQPQNNQFKLEGVVVNSATGKPLPRALVQVAGRALLTGRQGDFAFGNLSAGTVQVQVSKPGFFALGTSPLSRESLLTTIVTVGADSGPIELKLAPEAIITGRVTNQDDEPLERALVQVLTYTSTNGDPQLRPASGNVLSDEDGNFRIANLPAGRYYVAVKAGTVARGILGAQTQQVSEAYPLLVYYPGTEELTAAVMMDLAPGQQMETPFSLALRPAYNVVGKVEAAGESKGLDPPMIIDGTGQSLLVAEKFNAKTGEFEFPLVPPGAYMVRLSGRDAKDHTLFAHHKITVSKPVADLKLSLWSGLDLQVLVHGEFTKPRPSRTCSYRTAEGNHQVTDCSDYPVVRLELTAVDALVPPFTTDYEPMRNPGELVVRGVLPGRYFVHAQGMLGGYAQSVRCGRQDLLQEPLTVAEGGTISPIEVTVRDDPATLKVTLRVAKPGQNTTVLLYAEGALLPSAKNRVMSRSQTSQTSFSQLAPGSYKVFAFDSMDGIDYDRPDTLAKYAAQAAHITLAANQEGSIMVDVIHTGD
jgi:hypothetical protein